MRWSTTTHGGQTLTAFKGTAIAGNEVFQIVLDPTAANGSYTFELFQEIDHTVGSNSIALTVGFRGTDADGDMANRGTFVVSIADDQPIATTGTGTTFLEDDVSGYPATDATPADDTAASQTASLNVAWGADDDTRAGSATRLGASLRSWSTAAVFRRRKAARPSRSPRTG